MLPDSHEQARERILVGSVPFEVTTLAEASNELVKLTRSKDPIPVRFANAYCVAMASSDPDYRHLLNGPGLNYPDGSPVVWCMRSKRTDMDPQRVRGPSLFNRVLDEGRRTDVRHFFLGTTEATLADLVSNATRRFPGIQIAGTHAPAFGPLNEKFFADAVTAVTAVDSDIVWLALGSPKQDFAAAGLALRLGQPCVAVGAAFDFLAGTSREAPRWIQNSGFEWLFRLSLEPRRLWRRYIFGNVQFILALLRTEVLSKRL